MKLKGHAKIELTDVHTGEKQVVEHDNMITNAVNDLCNPIGLHACGLSIPSLTYDKPLVESLFGGLMLWEETLNDDPNDYFFPNGVNCVGYACDKANAGINNMMGTYNSSESGYQEDGSHKKVWDFSTSQANGTIASLSLVPTYAGNAGWGVNEYDGSLNESRDTYYNAEFQINKTDEAYSRDMDLYIKEGYMYSVKSGNVRYDSSKQNVHISRNGGKLILQKILYPANKISLFTKAYYMKFVEEIEIQLPSDFVDSISKTSTSYYGMCIYDDVSESINLIIYGSGTVDAGATIIMCRISISDFSCTTYSITIPVKVLLTEKLYMANLYVNLSGDVLVFREGPYYGLLLINIQSNEYTEINARISYLGDSSENYIYAYYNGEFYVIDTKAGVSRRLNTTSITGVEGHSIKFVGNKIYRKLFNKMTVFHHIMLTKNNLSSPVTKTASQTMKITYTISKET